jgi:iron complex transport system ATP-binding protein
MVHSTSNACIITKDLTIGYTHRGIQNRLLESLNLELRRGELVCFMGQNGIGKSTLIRTLASLQKPLSGTIAYRTDDSVSKVKRALPHHLAVVLTDRITAVNMTVTDVVAFGRYPYLSWSVEITKKDEEIIHNTLEEIHIYHLRDKKIHELSDGQIQMVMIARAVVQDTPVILLDEPTAHLDLNNRLEVMNLLRNLAHKFKKAILVSTHELDLALQTADLIWLAGHDKKIIIGVPEDLVLDNSFDSVFRFKGFDLKTGKVQHEAHRHVDIQLIGSGHSFLWTKNCFERSGFNVTQQEGNFIVNITQNEQRIEWTLDNKLQFSTLRELLLHLGER